MSRLIGLLRRVGLIILEISSWLHCEHREAIQNVCFWLWIAALRSQ